MYYNANNYHLDKIPEKFTAFSGYASIFEKPDKDGDILKKGVFEKTLSMQNKNQDIKLLWEHNEKLPVGKILKIEEDGKGMYVFGIIYKNSSTTKNLCEMVEGNLINGLSVGYIPVREKLNKNNQKEILNAELIEISIVTLPSNDEARIVEATNSDGLKDLPFSNFSNKSLDTDKRVKKLKTVFKRLHNIINK